MAFLVAAVDASVVAFHLASSSASVVVASVFSPVPPVDPQAAPGVVVAMAVGRPARCVCVGGLLSTFVP